MQFWENRVEVMQGQGSECVASAAFDREHHRENHMENQSQQRAFALKIVGSSHPVNEDRVEKLREELGRWRTERERVLTELRAVRGTNVDQARS